MQVKEITETVNINNEISIISQSTNNIGNWRNDSVFDLHSKGNSLILLFPTNKMITWCNWIETHLP